MNMSHAAISTPEALPQGLVRERAAQCSRKLTIDPAPFVAALEERYGATIKAILLYGSCLHTQSLKESVVDLYVVVDDYGRAYKKRSLQLLNHLLPPNVFYLALPGPGLGQGQEPGQSLRAKYGLISLADLEKGATRWFHSYIWGRFAQPTRIVYAQDETTRIRLHQILAAATVTFLKESIPVLGNSIVDSEAIWTRGLALSYAAELRPEPADRARQLTHLNMGDCQRLVAGAAPALAGLVEVLPHERYRGLSDERRCRRTLRRWRVRTWQGRLLSLMRLAKAAFTFADCVDYAAWKIERHTGVRIEVTPQLRRHPLLLGWRVLLRLLNKGALH